MTCAQKHHCLWSDKEIAEVKAAQKLINDVRNDTIKILNSPSK